MDQYANSPGHSTYCYVELAASFINFLHYCSPSSGFYGVGKDNRGRCTDNLSGHQTIRPPPTSIISPFVCRMSFLLQPSLFILAWNRHQIMSASIPLVPCQQLTGNYRKNSNAAIKLTQLASASRSRRAVSSSAVLTSVSPDSATLLSEAMALSDSST